ncbi:MAG: DUF362 domain-containing protein [Candidatus Omnitrophota bacterium]|jgi:hypothetical protein
MSNVFLKKINYETLLKNPEEVLKGIEVSGIADDFKKDQFAGLKIHFGEKGNKSYINPNFLLPLVKFLKKRQARPFLFETNTLYHGQRANTISHMNLAFNHGFGKLDVPIIIGDGIKGNDYVEMQIDKKHFSTCYLASALKDVDYLLVLSHLTGHMLTGFGAAIKNLGMGCASRRGKLAQHCQVTPFIHDKRCTLCGLCKNNCPAMAIEKKESACFVVQDKCIGCAQCISVCPVGAVDIIWSEEYNLIGEKLVEYAYAVTNKVKCAYINFCLYVTKECDCMNKEEKGFIKDIGMLFSRDPVAIDKASIDLALQEENKDMFLEIHPKIEYMHHLQYAQSIGLGSLEYKLIEI